LFEPEFDYFPASVAILVTVVVKAVRSVMTVFIPVVSVV
jgi:hypothetical protein